MTNLLRSILVAALLALVSGSDLAAQQPRYELGKRVRRFEQAWQAADAEKRSASTASMEKAVTLFFSLRLADAAQALDEAWYAVRPQDSPTPEQRWAYSRTLEVDRRWNDASATSLQVKLVELYAAEGRVEGDANVELRLSPDSQLAAENPPAPLVETRASLAELEAGWTWETGALPAGDHRLQARIVWPTGSADVIELTLSRSEQQASRLEQLRESIAALRETAAPTAIASLEAARALLSRVSDGETLESDVPAEQLLNWCEAVIAAHGVITDVVRAKLSQDQWVVLGDGKRRLPIRMRGPREANEPLPVLIALHGAGGSENMFFETYGAGRLVDLAVERGWLVVAPRQGLTGLAMGLDTLLDTLETVVPIDRDQVMLVGHSMGAMQAVRQASAHPGRVAAVAAIGGGGDPKGMDLEQVPFLVGAGDRDFGRSGAKSLVSRLERLGAPVNYVEYPQTEHMVVMQASLDDVFRFLDETLAKGTP